MYDEAESNRPITVYDYGTTADRWPLLRCLYLTEVTSTDMPPFARRIISACPPAQARSLLKTAFINELESLLSWICLHFDQLNFPGLLSAQTGTIAPPEKRVTAGNVHSNATAYPPQQFAHLKEASTQVDCCYPSSDRAPQPGCSFAQYSNEALTESSVTRPSSWCPHHEIWPPVPPTSSILTSTGQSDQPVRYTEVESAAVPALPAPPLPPFQAFGAPFLTTRPTYAQVVSRPYGAGEHISSSDAIYFDEQEGTYQT